MVKEWVKHTVTYWAFEIALHVFFVEQWIFSDPKFSNTTFMRQTDRAGCYIQGCNFAYNLHVIHDVMKYWYVSLVPLFGTSISTDNSLVSRLMVRVKLHYSVRMIYYRLRKFSIRVSCSILCPLARSNSSMALSTPSFITLIR